MARIIQHNTEHITVAPPDHEVVRRTANRVLFYVLDVVEAVLLVRLILRLLGANPESGFAQFVYSITYPFVAAFISLFPTPSAGGAVLEWFTIVAMIVYALIFYGIIKLLNITLYRDTKETIQEEIEEKEVL